MMFWARRPQAHLLINKEEMVAPAHLLIGVSIFSCEHQDTSVGCEIFNTPGTKNPGLGLWGCVQGDGICQARHPGCVAIGQSPPSLGPSFLSFFFKRLE